MLHLASVVLRDPSTLLDRDLSELAPRLLALAASGALLFGVVVGSYRGGIQLLYAGVKLPVLLLLPVVVGLPAVTALYRAGGGEVSWRRVALAGLAGLARTGILAAAASPILWLVYSLHIDYHAAVLLMAGALAAVGLPGLAVVRLALPQTGSLRFLAVAGSILLLGLITMQTGWVLRPFVARPTAEVTFLRPVEADVFSSLGATATAAGGYYQDWEAESSGLVGRGLR